MEQEKYKPTQQSVAGILGDIENDSIAIPEIQRPFVWKPKQVSELIDSLFNGYPTGYLIIWKNPNVRLKDGSYSNGKKILIDGQQRVTALMTSIAGKEIINDEYKKIRIKVAFNPFEALSDDKDANVFQIPSGAILKDKKWIPDISIFFKNNFSSRKFINEYCENNPEMDEDKLEILVDRIRDIQNRLIGIIELSDHLDIDVVTDIFIRINSKGTVLSQGDFVMSKIAADEVYGGNDLRKAIDYFAHLCKVPEYYDFISDNDKDFTETQYFPKLKWLRTDNENVYDPDYDDVIRVAFMTKYNRAKLADLVALLSGRDFETREFKQVIIEDTYLQLSDGVIKVINVDNFKNFMQAIRSAGFVSPKLVNSAMAIDFAYTLYLRLKETKEVNPSEYKRIIQKWYVLSVLTGRYTGSPESAFYRDIRLINERGIVKAFEDIEAGIISDSFWDVKLVQDLEYTSVNNPTYQVYLASQVFFNDISLLSNSTTVRELIINVGDVHHIFPKAYLKKNGFVKSKYNQEGNYAYLDTQVNKSICDDAPNVYFKKAFNQCETKDIECGSILDLEQLKKNLDDNCIPEDVIDMDYNRYEEFLDKRRVLMARKIKKYYYSL